MSAERLREAARVLRERAEAATPGPWEATDGFGRDAGRAYVVPSDPEIPTYVSAGGSPDEDRDADYIATMHPGVGLALARALSTAADAMEHGDLCLDCFHPTCLTVGELIPVADLILGDAS